MDKLSSLSTLLRKASLLQEAASVNILKHSADQSEIDFQNGQTVKPEYGHQEGDFSKVPTVAPPRGAYVKRGDEGVYTVPAERRDKNGNILHENIEVDAVSTIKNSRINTFYPPNISSSDIKDSTLTVSVVKGSAIHHSVVEGSFVSTVIDSSIVDSQLFGEFIIKDSVSITNSTMSTSVAGYNKCNLKDRVTIINSNCIDVNLTATRVVQSELDTVKLAEYSSFESSRVSSTGRIYDCKFVNSDIAVMTAMSSTCLNVKNARFGELIAVIIQDSNFTTVSSIKGDSKSKPIYIQYANIDNGLVRISGSAQIIGFPSQYAEIGDSATIRGNAHVTGRVIGRAIVEGNAKVEGKCTISGDCVVGGTARMISGEYTTGEYMSGEHSGGSKGVLQSVVDSATSAVKGTYNKVMGKE
jgi:hypothetical protein